ncbi:unnamed protein product [Anisakis simplex]|uniref:EGF-like domain-containing protein n=1 Tax=Anisakis simplex TaxID=6269 RepID=A0A3P6P0D0_ANISI|nr:unnamed protein product [Anisakis simplex]
MKNNSNQSNEANETVAYVWMPQHYLLQKDFWEPGEPKKFPNMSAVCIYLGWQSSFVDWITSPCEINRYYLCHRDATNEGDQLMYAQCLCVNGYRGEFCEEHPQTAVEVSEGLLEWFFDDTRKGLSEGFVVDTRGFTSNAGRLALNDRAN